MKQFRFYRDAECEGSLRAHLHQVIRLSIPAVLAEISSIVMQYIDAAMVGSLGADATAAIGLVTSTTWLFGGLCISFATGFAVQTAHLIGAGREQDARSVLRQAVLCTLLFGLALSAAGIGISRYLPVWLGGDHRQPARLPLRHPTAPRRFSRARSRAEAPPTAEGCRTAHGAPYPTEDSE